MTKKKNSKHRKNSLSLGQRMVTAALVVLAVSGIFIMLDAVLIHAISYDYGKLGLQWLDQYMDHFYIGLLLVGIALLGAHYRR